MRPPSRGEQKSQRKRARAGRASRARPSARVAVPRVGFGYDVHRLVPGRRLRLCGVDVPSPVGPLAHSDGDCALHALMDAILGACGLPDLGQLFPNTDARFAGADSRRLLTEVMERARRAGYRVSSVDVFLLVERPRLSPHLAAMRAALAACLRVSPDAVGLQATSGEGLGFVGRGEGLAAWAVAVMTADEAHPRSHRTKKGIGT